MAERRPDLLERKFDAQPHFIKLYHAFIDEYISLDHMTKLNDLDKSTTYYFLPHLGA